MPLPIYIMLVRLWLFLFLSIWYLPPSCSVFLSWPLTFLRLLTVLRIYCHLFLFNWLLSNACLYIVITLISIQYLLIRSYASFSRISIWLGLWLACLYFECHNFPPYLSRPAGVASFPSSFNVCVLCCRFLLILNSTVLFLFIQSTFPMPSLFSTRSVLTLLIVRSQSVFLFMQNLPYASVIISSLSPPLLSSACLSLDLTSVYTSAFTELILMWFSDFVTLLQHPFARIWCRSVRLFYLFSTL